MKKAYLVTEMASLDYVASSLVNSYYNDAALKEIEEIVRKEYPDFDWQLVKLDELYTELKEDEATLIVLAKKAKPYQHALKSKYQNSEVLLSEAFVI